MGLIRDLGFEVENEKLKKEIFIIFKKALIWFLAVLGVSGFITGFILESDGTYIVIMSGMIFGLAVWLLNLLFEAKEREQVTIELLGWFAAIIFLRRAYYLFAPANSVVAETIIFLFDGLFIVFLVMSGLAFATQLSKKDIRRKKAN
ncbi:MAG: hypothetical protein ACE5OZ_07995 [Candidatus Heimdallarchaeota archaeon]